MYVPPTLLTQEGVRGLSHVDHVKRTGPRPPDLPRTKTELVKMERPVTPVVCPSWGDPPSAARDPVPGNKPSARRTRVAEGRDAGAKWRLRSPSHPIAPARTRDATDSQFRWVKGVGKGWVGNEKEEGDGCNPFLDRAERTQFELEVRRCVRSVTHARTHARTDGRNQ
jgi:hypothetical protein